MAVAHAFQSLTNIDAAGSVLLLGAGMSTGIAPSANDLARSIRDRHGEIIAELDIDPGPAPNDGELYDWADRAFKKLKAKHVAGDEAKKRLAKAIGITTDLRYQANVSSLLRTAWPRHRVTARFARESRWKSVWSLNWDCVQESALECVGFKRHPNPGHLTPSPVPWPDWFCTWCPGDTFAPAAQPGTVFVVKPHGCVQRLAKGSSTFIVTSSELGELTPELQPVAAELGIGFSHSPLVTVGWRAEEDYIHANIEGLKANGTLVQGVADRLSVINRTWYPTPPDVSIANHLRLANAFGVSSAQCFFPGGATNQPSTDDILLWVQTRFALQLLIRYASANSGWSLTAPALNALLSAFAEPASGSPVNAFFDDFLAVWVRFCFNAAKVRYLHNAAPVPKVLSPTPSRDLHIPWGYGHTERTDLLSAVPLLLKISEGYAAGEKSKWDFGKFPGGLWNGESGHLVVPLPAWGDVDEQIALSAIKPLMEDRSWEAKGSIRRISVLPMRGLPDAAPFTDSVFALRSSVAGQMPGSTFAAPSSIDLVGMDVL